MNAHVLSLCLFQVILARPATATEPPELSNVIFPGTARTSRCPEATLWLARGELWRLGTRPREESKFDRETLWRDLMGLPDGFSPLSLPDVQGQDDRVVGTGIRKGWLHECALEGATCEPLLRCHQGSCARHGKCGASSKRLLVSTEAVWWIAGRRLHAVRRAAQTGTNVSLRVPVRARATLLGADEGGVWIIEPSARSVSYATVDEVTPYHLDCDEEHADVDLMPLGPGAAVAACGAQRGSFDGSLVALHEGRVIDLPLQHVQGMGDQHVWDGSVLYGVSLDGSENLLELQPVARARSTAPGILSGPFELHQTPSGAWLMLGWFNHSQDRLLLFGTPSVLDEGRAAISVGLAPQ